MGWTRDPSQECTGQVPGDCPSHIVEVRWADWSWVHLAWPLATLATLSVAFLLLVGPLLRCQLRRSPGFRRWVETYVGTQDVKAKCSHWLIAMSIAEMVASAVIIVIWAAHTYNHAVSTRTLHALYVLTAVNFANWAISRVQSECEAQSLWETASLVDVFTIVPMLHLAWRVQQRRSSGEDEDLDWLSLHFLRAHSVRIAFQQIQGLSYHLQNTGLVVQLFTSMVLRMSCLIVMMAGTIFTSEVLGDPVAVGETFSFVETPSGDKLSFVQMTYWVVCSITTVGYGDFAPRTVISRLVTAVFILIGVVYIFWEQYRFSYAWSQLREGSGSYWPQRKGGGLHVVLFLCSHRGAAPFSSMVAAFLREIMHIGNRDHAQPDVVIFSQTLWDVSDGGNKKASTFVDFLRSEGFCAESRRRVTFIVGKFTSKADMDRCGVSSSYMTFLLSDVNSDVPDMDDEENIFTAVMLREYYPSVRLRLMLLRPESKELAVQAGVEIVRCFSLRQLKANILAQNVRCHGLIPVLIGLLKSVDAASAEEGAYLQGKLRRKSNRNGHDKHEDSPLHHLGGAEDDSFHDYMEGLQRNVYGFEVAESYAGSSFHEFAARVFQDTGAVVFATYAGAQILLCPEDIGYIHHLQICFAIAPSQAALQACSAPEYEPEHWRVSFLQSRMRELKRIKRDGPHVAAAQIMGGALRKTLVGVPEDSRKIGRRRSFQRTSSGGSVASRFNDNDSVYGGSVSAAVSQFEAMMRQSATSTGQEETARSQQARVKDLRMGLTDGEELVVLVVCRGEVWQQAHTFVTGLRAKYLPVLPPIVIFAPTQPPPLLFEDCGSRVVVLEGLCTKARMLLQAGVLEASAVVVMTGEQCGESLYQDSRVALCAQVIECWCGLSEREVFATYELQESGSVKTLPDLLEKPSVNLSKFLAERAFLEEDDDDSEAEDIDATDLTTASGNGGTWGSRIFDEVHRLSVDEGIESAVTQELGTSAIFHPRFAAGQIFTPEIWGAMLGRMVHMPAIIELVEALVMPHRRGQNSFPWQVRVPTSYFGRPYSELFLDLVRGTLRLEDQSLRGAAGPRLPPEGARAARANKARPAIAIALYRCKKHEPGHALGTGGHNYNVLAPSRGLSLREGDWVLALGNRRFGKSMHQEGLLRGSTRLRGGEPVVPPQRPAVPLSPPVLVQEMELSPFPETTVDEHGVSVREVTGCSCFDTVHC